MGRLVGGIERLGLAGKVDLIVTSDHGMAETAPERTVYLGSCSDRAQYNDGVALAVLLCSASKDVIAFARS